MKMKNLWMLVFSVVFLAGCTSAVTSPTPQTAASTATVPAINTPTPPPSPEPATPTTAPTQTTVDQAPAQMAAIQALSKEKNIPADQIKVVSMEAVTWPDGCLGVVLPGVMCTQSLVEGYRIVLSANGEQFEYHTNQDGTNVINAAHQLALVKFAVSKADKSVALVNPQIALGPTFNPTFSGLLPIGGSVAGTAYVLDITSFSKGETVDNNGVHDLSFIQSPTYGLALWRGGVGTKPRLAWGTQLTGSGSSSSLMVSNLDGSQLETLLDQPASTGQPLQLVAEAWSADGGSLYFSKEPVGLGGYILFSGASDLYKIDIASKQVTDVIPMAAYPPVPCLDDLSGDYNLVADHCTENVITVRNLGAGTSSTIQPPAGVTDFRVMGSARFSPDGKRLAFAIAKSDPNSEQGWVAVSDGDSGSSKLVMTGEPGTYDTVIGWLSDNLVLVQANLVNCTSNCENQLWVVGADGSNPTKVADGTFLTVVDSQ